MNNIKLKNLKEVCSQTRSNCGVYITSIYVDISDGELMSIWDNISDPSSSFFGSNIIFVCSTSSPMSMSQIKSAVFKAISSCYV